MIDLNIIFEIYGSGSQLSKIKKLLKDDYYQYKNKSISKIFFYKGLIKKKDILNVFKNADCCMLQIANFKSLSMVIPSKIFEYTASGLPIIFSSEGFTRNFISKIDNSIYFKNNNAKSFLNAIISSMKSNTNLELRNRFLKKFDQDLILNKYVDYILENA
tara:strand:+ start:14 stop:493 length:480 start_codon:yes stop_codon:yes gene_type:complete